MKDKRYNTVWLTEDEPRPEVLTTGFRSRKRMFTIFFHSQGPVAVDIMPDKATITATYYTTSVLPKVLQHIQSTARTRRRSRIQLHHNNAGPPKAHLTQTYLDQNFIRLMEHPLLLTRLGRMRLLALSKIQIKHWCEAFFKNPRPCQSFPFRDKGYTCFRVPPMLWEVEDEDATVYTSRGKLLRRNVTVIFEIVCGS